MTRGACTVIDKSVKSWWVRVELDIVVQCRGFVWWAAAAVVCSAVFGGLMYVVVSIKNGIGRGSRDSFSSPPRVVGLGLFFEWMPTAGGWLFSDRFLTYGCMYVGMYHYAAYM